MAYVLIKRAKFLEGWSYGTGVGYSFTWTHDESKARRFADAEPVDHLVSLTHGRLELRDNNRAELRAIAKERVRIREAGFHPKTIHDRINHRAA